MKKLLLLVPVVALLAAGCSSSQPPASQSANQSANQPAANSTPASSMPPSGNPATATGSGLSLWQATLMASNNAAKGNYIITVAGHTVYLNTSRDYSALIGKPVNISYTGSLTSFSLGNITAQ